VSSLKLTTEQKLIAQARFHGKSFWEIPDDKLRFATDEIIIATSAITGADVPQSELMAKYLSDELVRYIMDFGYEDYTVDEIITAVRINSKTKLKNPAGEDLQTTDAPHRVNVYFLAACLANYEILRKNIDRLIENKIKGY